MTPDGIEIWTRILAEVAIIATFVWSLRARRVS